MTPSLSRPCAAGLTAATVLSLISPMATSMAANNKINDMKAAVKSIAA